MNVITTFLQAAAANLGVGAPPGASQPSTAAIRPSPFHSLSGAAQSALRTSTSMKTHFPSALLIPGAELSNHEIDLNEVVQRDSAVRRAASNYSCTFARLVEVAAYQKAIAAAIQTVKSTASKTEVASLVANEINLQCAAIDAELDAVKQEQLVDAQVRRDRSTALQPLRAALDARHTSARESLAGTQAHIEILSSGRATQGAYHRSREILLGLGVVDKKISEMLNTVPPADPQIALQEMRLKAHKLSVEVEAFTAYNADPFHSFEHLAGLGLDALINAQRKANEATPS